MNVTSSLTFSWSPATAAIAIIAVAAVASLSFIACRRTRWRRSTLLLEVLRIFAVVLAAILLGGPQWVQQYRPESKPVVAILYDDSASMTTRDAIRSGDASSAAISRSEAIRPLTLPATWASLADRAEILIQPFAGAEQHVAPETLATNSLVNERVNEIANRANNPALDISEILDEPGTDLASPLVNAATKNESLLGIILASDGDWNKGDAPVQAASRLRLLGVPVFSFPVGSKTRLPDVELISFDVPTSAVAGKRVRIPFSIDSSLPRDHLATVTMKSSSGEEVSKDVRIAAMGRTSESIDWLPTELGDDTLSLSIPRHADEIREDNNSSTAPIQIRQERLRVLVIESLPRWEYRYLRNALSRDPGVEVSCLLFHPGLDKRGGGSSDYVKEFPATKEELAKYDVIFLGDVGTDEGQLTPEQCDWLAGLVREQASGLVFLPGLLGHQFSLLETELADLMPVTLEAGQPGGWGSRTPQHFELTELGRRSLLTKLADTRDENLEVWGNLPGFQWHAPVLAAKPGTETLAVHQEMSNQYGRLPLLVTRTVGAGKVLFMATDGAWRWRKGVEDLYHYRFWGQVVRWMAYQRNMVQGETMRLYYSPEQPQVRQTITFNANVMEASGEPLSGGDVTLRIEPPAGAATSVRFESAGDAWGAFTGRFTPRQAGEHRLTLVCKETNKSLETKIVVQGVALEQIGKPARPDVLEEISRVTRGQVLTLDRVDDIVQLLAAMPDPPPAIRRIPLWSHPLVVGLFIVLLGVFWAGRKGVGLI